MRKTIQTLIKKVFQKIGMYIQYYPNPEKLYHHLKDKHQKIKEYEIKRITKEVARVQDHKFYDAFIKLYIPSWNVNYQEALFFGKGMGESSLDSYRRIIINKQSFYEKIYFNNYSELNTILWFGENVAPLLSEDIKTASPDLIFKGEEITALYFPFLNLKPIPIEEVEKKLIEFSKNLYNTSINKDINSLIEKAPDSLKDFRNHFLYQRNIKLAKCRFLEYGINFVEIEEMIEKSRKILTHGDLNEGNGFERQTLIDWDSFGILPIGLEAAYLYYRIHLRGDKIIDYKQWLKQHYEDVIPPQEWRYFENNFIYFLFVFSCNLFSDHEILKGRLIKALK